MQGRLSPLVNNQIQAFPFDTWREEFPLAEKLGLTCIEWTLDYPNLRSNPLLISENVSEITNIRTKYKISIPSVTLDCCMQRPFWQDYDQSKNYLLEDFEKIIQSAAALNISILVIPLVDNGSIKSNSEFLQLKRVLNSFHTDLNRFDIRIAFESDYEPIKLKKFIEEFDSSIVGINYDTGNSASLGFDPTEEIALYGNRIINVHIKDRVFNGTTVPLGEGNADFEKVFTSLALHSYKGNFILQTARSKDNKHYIELEKNLSFLNRYI